MKWENWELKEIDKAVENINTGSSIYSQVVRLWIGTGYSNPLIKRRSWDSIRSKIGRGLKRGTTFKSVK